MMLQTMGGKMAPRPSLAANRSTTHCSARRSARRRSGSRPRRSRNFSPRSSVRKKRSQLNSPVRPFCPGQRSGGHSWGGFKNSSEMPSRGSSSVTGRQADMIDNGTMIVRDQELTRYKLIGNHRGKSSASGGTAGHSAYEICPSSAR